MQCSSAAAPCVTQAVSSFRLSDRGIGRFTAGVPGLLAVGFRPPQLRRCFARRSCGCSGVARHRQALPDDVRSRNALSMLSSSRQRSAGVHGLLWHAPHVQHVVAPAGSVRCSRIPSQEGEPTLSVRVAGNGARLMSTSPRFPVNWPSMYSSVLASCSTDRQDEFNKATPPRPRTVQPHSATEAHLEVHVGVRGDQIACAECGQSVSSLERPQFRALGW